MIGVTSQVFSTDWFGTTRATQGMHLEEGILEGEGGICQVFISSLTPT